MTLTAAQLRDDFRYLFKDELPALQLLVRGLPPKPLVINIGAGAGTSGLAILEARPDSVLITVDIQDASSPFGCLEAERDVVNRAGIDTTYRHYQICADSVEVGVEWLDGGNMVFGGPIFSRESRLTSDIRWGKHPDMVFIDGDHSYEHARDDIQIWIRVLKNDGVLAVHDYLKDGFVHSVDGPHPKNWPGVDRAVQENLIDKYPQILHVDSLIAFKKAPL